MPKIREFGQIMADRRVIEEADEIFLLIRTYLVLQYWLIAWR